MTTVHMSNRHEEIGRRVRKARLATGLSQERFAPLIGVTRRHLIRLENGEHRPGRELATRIEQVVEEITGEPPRERILPDEEEEESDLQFATLDALLLAFVDRRIRAALRS